MEKIRRAAGCLLIPILLITLFSEIFLNPKSINIAHASNGTVTTKGQFPAQNLSVFFSTLTSDKQVFHDVQAKSKMTVSWDKPNGSPGDAKDLSWHINIYNGMEHVAGPITVGYNTLLTNSTATEWGKKYNVIVTLVKKKQTIGTATLSDAKAPDEALGGQAEPDPASGSCPINTLKWAVERAPGNDVNKFRVNFSWLRQAPNTCIAWRAVKIYRPGETTAAFEENLLLYTDSHIWTWTDNNPVPGVYKFVTASSEIINLAAGAAGGLTSGAAASAIPLHYDSCDPLANMVMKCSFETAKVDLAPESYGAGNGKISGGTQDKQGENNNPSKQSAIGGDSQCDAINLANPMKGALQFATCVFLSALDTVWNKVIDFLTSIKDLVQIQPKFDQTQKYAWLGIQSAHASLSSSLNPDPNISGPKVGWVIDIWKTMRAFINIFLIFMIIFIAFANIFRINIDKYAVKKALPGLVLGVLLANFSALICRGILDISELLQNFVSGGSPGIMLLVTVLKTFSVLGIIGIIVGVATSFAGVGLAIMLIALLPIIGFILGGLIILFTLVLRIGLIWALFAISPLAFLCLGSPMTSGMFKKWWDEFFRWAFLPVVLYFIIWLASQVVKNNWGIAGMTQTILVIALLWTAVFLPFKMKGWLTGAVMGFANNNIMKPAGKGLKFAGGAGLGAWENYAQKKGLGAWATPHLTIGGWANRAKQQRTNTQAIRASQGDAIRRDVWEREGGLFGIVKEVKKGRGREIYNKIKNPESGIKEMLVKDAQMREKGKESADAGRDDNISAAFSHGRADQPRTLSEDELRDIEARDLALAKEKNINEKFKTVMNYHKTAKDKALEARRATTPQDREKALTEMRNAKQLRDQAVHSMNFKDWDHFQKKVVKAKGGIMGRDAKINYCVQQYGDDRGRHMYHLISDTSVNEGDDSWHGGIRMNPQTGKPEWNRNAVIDPATGAQATDPTTGELVWDYSAAEAEAVDLTSKREEQVASRMGTYLSWAEMNDDDGQAIGGSLSSYAKELVTTNSETLDGMLNQKRRNKRLEEHWTSRDTAGKSTLQNIIQAQRDAVVAAAAANKALRAAGKPETAKPPTRMLDERVENEMKKGGNFVDFDATNSNHVLYKEAGLLDIDAKTGKIIGFKF